MTHPVIRSLPLGCPRFGGHGLSFLTGCFRAFCCFYPCDSGFSGSHPGGVGGNEGGPRTGPPSVVAAVALVPAPDAHTDKSGGDCLTAPGTLTDKSGGSPLLGGTPRPVPGTLTGESGGDCLTAPGTLTDESGGSPRLVPDTLTGESGGAPLLGGSPRPAPGVLTDESGGSPRLVSDALTGESGGAPLLGGSPRPAPGVLTDESGGSPRLVPDALTNESGVAAGVSEQGLEHNGLTSACLTSSCSNSQTSAYISTTSSVSARAESIGTPVDPTFSRWVEGVAGCFNRLIELSDRFPVRHDSLLMWGDSFEQTRALLSRLFNIIPSLDPLSTDRLPECLACRNAIARSMGMSPPAETPANIGALVCQLGQIIGPRFSVAHWYRSYWSTWITPFLEKALEWVESTLELTQSFRSVDDGICRILTTISTSSWQRYGSHSNKIALFLMNYSQFGHQSLMSSGGLSSPPTTPVVISAPPPLSRSCVRRGDDTPLGVPFCLPEPRVNWTQAQMQSQQALSGLVFGQGECDGRPDPLVGRGSSK